MNKFKVTWTNRLTGDQHRWYFTCPKEMRKFIWELRESNTQYKIHSINPFS
jgi:hypothetical protein